METELLGWPDEDPTLDLDHRAFSYAGKFVMSSTGKAVGRADGQVIAAAAFDPDRTEPSTLVIRYLTVREDHRGEGVGPELVEFLLERAAGRGFDAVAIHVNNPYSYVALYKAGFEFTGERTGLAELKLARSVDATADPDPANYREGLARFADRNVSEAESRFVERKLEAGPPEPTDGPEAGE
jgi:GNAT superfamily N-acetyltransferase